MNEDEIMEKLSYDISEIELPPISEKVLQAVREKSESCCKTIENNVENVKVRRITTVKCVFAAIIAFLVLSIPIIVVLSNNNTNPVITEESQILNNSKSDVSKADTPNETNNPSVLEKIKLKEVYGTVALTKRPEEECELYLMNYDPDNSVYEDDNYLYNFDSDGNLVEIINTQKKLISEIGLSESEIKTKAENLFSFYFPLINSKEYTITVKENKNALPAWKVDFVKETDGIANENIRMTFDKSGMLCMLISTQMANDIGNISKIQAVEIALEEIQNERYHVLSFDKNDVEIWIELNEMIHSYIVTIDYIPLEYRNFTISALIKINYDSGKIISVEIEE